jgi:hypothetical protein
MKLYRSTTEGLAQAILDEGFRDEGVAITYWTDRVFTSVWLSDCQLGSNEARRATWRLRWKLTAGQSESTSGRRKEGTYREWLIPAALLNACAVISERTQSPPKQAKETSVEPDVAGRAGGHLGATNDA